MIFGLSLYLLCLQGSPHSDQETFHQCAGGVGLVAALCVGMARVYRDQGKCSDYGLCGHGHVGGRLNHPIWLPPLSDNSHLTGAHGNQI